MKANGNTGLFTVKGNAPGGTSVAIQANSDGSLAMVSEYGGITISTSGIVVAHSSGSAVQLNSSGITLIGSAIGLNGATVSLGAGTATGVATQASQAAFNAALVAFATTLGAVLNPATITGILLAPGPQQAALTAAMTALTTIPLLPTNYSTSVKAGL